MDTICYFLHLDEEPIAIEIELIKKVEDDIVELLRIDEIQVGDDKYDNTAYDKGFEI